MRPEGTYGSDPHGEQPYDPYADPGAFEAAVGRLADPLNDPLPGPDTALPGPYPQPYPSYEEPYRHDAYPADLHALGGPHSQAHHSQAHHPPAAPVPGADVHGDGWYGTAAPPAGAAPAPPVVSEPSTVPEPPVVAEPASEPAPVLDDETMLLRQAEEPSPKRTEPARPPDGGRAARRRAQRARRESPAVIASRVLGELFITFGVVMLLFVSYQLWWTNVIANQQAGNEAKKLEQQWEEKGGDRDPGVFSPGQGFAIMHIPKLDVKVPIAEGVDENGVLDRGMVGHYAEEPLKTAMPWDEKGNFAVAGHRNTHGEPFRYINKLDPGDPIVVETKDTYYVYEMTSRLDSTLPSNVGVIDPVPKDSGFTEPGRYVTLTTCTPEFTSKYRLIVWGKMVEERPRSEGMPDALVR
ncbi:class E sortase [Streptomyces megasporus]|uniref:class E sortase n=1 Tax=Streptomyces megasporus TaxID=44060 RepID=UPI003CCBA47E